MVDGVISDCRVKCTKSCMLMTKNLLDKYNGLYVLYGKLLALLQIDTFIRTCYKCRASFSLSPWRK